MRRVTRETLDSWIHFVESWQRSGILAAAQPICAPCQVMMMRTMPLFHPDDLLDHLSNIRELEFSDNVLGEPLKGRWFILGAQTFKEWRTRHGVEESISRQVGDRLKRRILETFQHG
jgi:hypothetical protein